MHQVHDETKGKGKHHGWVIARWWKVMWNEGMRERLGALKHIVFYEEPRSVAVARVSKVHA